MTRQTIDYLLRNAIGHRDALALEMLGSDTPSPAWGEAAAAVKELLEFSTGSSATASEIGRKGGAAKVRKGLAMLSPERRSEIAYKGVAAKRAKRAAEDAICPQIDVSLVEEIDGM